MNTISTFGGHLNDFFSSRFSPKIIFSILFFSCSLTANSQVSITSGGTPSYSYSIVVPPGIGGMTPNIGLLYSGSSVNGPVGYGWTIQGISTISRCPANKLVDGVGRGVEFSVHDKLCLDGQRLIQTDANGAVVNAINTAPTLANPFQQNDSLGGTGLVREYRTEKDIYARIRAYGAAGGDAANGPAYFRVWTKSGQIFEYGVNANATSNALITPQGKTVVSSWAVSRISDTVGNFIDFEYVQRDLSSGSVPATGSNLGREWNLSEIRYTGNASQLPKNKIVFEYVERPLIADAVQDRAEAYHKGSKNLSVQLLSRVRTYINWIAGQSPKPANAVNVKTIKLTYDNGPITKRSRVKQITECAGASETVCLPPTTYNYSAGGGSSYMSNEVFKLSSLSTLTMDSTTGNYGVITGNFFGSGRTDILRWSDNPGENLLYRSEGDGSFYQMPVGSAPAKFNITDQNLFKSNGCYSAVTSDFNGDGLTDILRLSKLVSSTGTPCGITTNILYKSNGDGSFTPQEITGIDFSQAISKSIPKYGCIPGSGTNCEPGPVRGTTVTAGSNYYLIDVNNDGLLDIVTTILPSVYIPIDAPSTPLDSSCATQTCTRVFLGKITGGFEEKTDTNLKNRSVYADPAIGAYSYWSKPYTVDANGDGATDLIVNSGVWLSNGDGNFSSASTAQSGLSCANALDFNGDGRVDCLNIYSSLNDTNLYLADGISVDRKVTNFNLRSPGQELFDFNGQLVQNVGTVLIDMNGDGRTDILRWKDDPSQNAVYLSNGDGSFSLDASFNLTSTSNQLRKSDGTSNFIIGDFTGRGSPEILRLKSSPSATSDATKNLLFVKSDATPPDQLISVVSGTGLTTTLTWVPLSNSSSGTLGKRYTTDLGTSSKASYPIIDVTMPTYVVATTVSDSGVGTSKLTSEYSYSGLKVANDGRGWLGFRETRRQNMAPDGSNLTVFTRYLQSAYSGMASMTETRMGALNLSAPQVLSRSTFVYCDKTASVGAEATATSDVPCPTSARVQKPYLYSSKEEGTDITGNVLPSVTTTNTFNDSGDPTKIVVVTKGIDPALGSEQIFTKTSTNTYRTDNTAGDAWILGRLEKANVQNAVPNSLAGISTSAGNAPYAAATQGVVPTGSAVITLGACSSTTPTTSPVAATTSCTVKNTGQMAANSISYSTINGVTVTGPTGACAAGATCGTVTVKTNTAAGTYFGTVTIAPDVGSAMSLIINLVVAPAVTTTTLTSSPTNLLFGTINKGIEKTLPITISNVGTVAATGLNFALTAVSGSAGNFINDGSGTCTSSLAAGASCTLSITFEAYCTSGAVSYRATTSGSNFSSVVTNMSATTIASGVCATLRKTPK
ncbi:FG-GAP-like repeat-containing protein [Undibacterium flavidum]|uniref:VCBS repeat-containing protein n=1 Tax=Undibacterium flavidum TaxID=2762297 RepID=A0ABR6YB99_9BURK|nr:FG-GAP-like repeat-containing protein [Undibacterium flavidum]MBC3873842.1 VCBS repeat-containing protein [Undibacterium flavidum]